jgi:predicted phosphate transport protein (TIGR00153 family)
MAREIVASFGRKWLSPKLFLRFARLNMFSLIPKDTSFFQMFEQMSDNLVTGARTLVDLFANYQDVERTIDTVQQIERHGDEMTHNVLTKLNQTFITPFDREDIHQLASSLDDVLDFVNASGARLVMYRITNPPPAAGELSRIILLQSQELQKAVALLQKQKNGDVLAHCVEINRLENEADQISQKGIATLFDNEKDPINLIKIKELLEFLERATDKAEDAANVLETVVLKNT